MTIIRGLIYARVSTEEQKKGGTSIPKQLEGDLAYNQAHGIETVGDRWYDLKQKRSVSEPNADCFADAAGHPVPVYVDDFTGTVPIEERPEGKRAYGWLTNDGADCLTVFSIDRLVRPKEDGDEWDIPTLIRSLAKSNKTIHTTENGKIDNTFVGLLIAVVGGKGAGDERRRILGRMADGKRRKMTELKKWVGTGFAPFGFTKIGIRKDAYLEINHYEEEIICRMRDIYLGWNGETKCGFDAMAALFNAEGLPVTGRMKSEKKRQKSEQRWHASAINRILSNRAIIGEFEWGGEVVTIPHLAIISREDFDAIQAQRVRNKIESPRNVKDNYLMRGRLTCTCGRKSAAIRMRNNGKLYQYYTCNRKYFDPSPDCDRKNIPADIVDRAAWRWLVDIFQNPEKLLTGIREYQARQRDKAEPNRARLAELPGLIAECKTQAQRLTRTLENMPEDDELAVKSLRERLSQISTAYKHYKAESDRITAELEATEVSEADIQQVLDWAGEIGKAIDTDAISFQARRKIFDRLNVTAQLEYQNGERGLRLDCPVLSVSKWRGLVSDCVQPFEKGCTQIVPQYSISGWVSLAEEFFGGAVKVAA